jgi:hypothetical protein
MAGRENGKATELVNGVRIDRQWLLEKCVQAAEYRGKGATEAARVAALRLIGEILGVLRDHELWLQLQDLRERLEALRDEGDEWKQR